MPLGDFATAGTLPKPLPIGRFGRQFAAAGSIGYFVWNVTQYGDLVGSDVPDAAFWIGVCFAFWYFSDLVVVGLSLPWGPWPQGSVLLFAVALIIPSIGAYGSVWGSPLGWGVCLFTEFFFGYIGVSFLLAAIFAGPG